MFSTLHKNPYLYILLAYVLAIFTGALLLMLPISTTVDISFIDAIYTATSAICVTGLTVLDTGTVYTVFGQLVIVSWIQIGGIGITVFSSFIMLTTRKEFSFLSQSVVEESLTMDRQIKVKKLVLYVAGITFLVELIGAVLLAFFFSNTYSTGQSIYYAVFTSISAFCNAGFSLFSNNFESFPTNVGINVTLMLLIFVGGIGYFCIIEVLKNLKNNKASFRDYRFSVHTKSAFYISLLLILFGAITFFAFEHDKLLEAYSVGDGILISLFQSVTSRTAGFNTFSFAHVNQATLLVFGALMFIGASPASCGGGVKTTTFGVLIKSFTASLKNREHVFMYGRSVPKPIVKKAILLIILAAVWVFIATMLISIFERYALVSGAVRLEDLVFEVISAFGTVGLSTGVSAKMSEASKIIIIATMYFGRTGLLTLVSFFAFSIKEERFNYPEEDVFVG